jgi:hypothetical protein
MMIFISSNENCEEPRMSHPITLALITSVLFLSSNCKQDIIPPTPPLQEPQWRLVSQFATLDIRYMIQQEGTLYLSGIDPAVTQTTVINNKTYYVGDRGLVFSTIDGIKWEKLRGFHLDVGPMTFNGDTLYCLASDTIFRYLPNRQWQATWATPPPMAYAAEVADIIFYKGILFGMAIPGTVKQTYRINPDGSYAELLVDQGVYQYTGAKFLKKSPLNGEEIIYVRPKWTDGWFYRFDGNLFIKIVDGLSADEMQYGSPSNSMIIKNDTLFAGFKFPGNIKIFINNKWQIYGDTLPNPESANVIQPNIVRTEPTAIAFLGDRMFVATHSMGVLEWTGEKKWKQISKGLVPGTLPNIVDSTLYAPLPFLEAFNGKLIAAYGKPGYGPWGGLGVYVYQ